MNYKVIDIKSARAAWLCGALLAGAASTFAQDAPKVTQAIAKPQPTAAEKVRDLKAVALATGVAISPASLGAFSADLVYTPVTPCRIVDTRSAGGPVSSVRTFDVDGDTFVAQGGSSSSCGIPFGVAAAVAMTISTPSSTGNGRVIAWGLGTQPNSAVLSFTAPAGASNTTIVPVVPGGGNDFSVSSSPATQLVIDVVGYFAAPVATALDCTSVASAVTTVPNNVYTPVDAICPTGRTATGGGTYPTEGTLGRPAIWTDGSPTVANGWRTWVDNQTGSNRTVQTYAVCCRVPGR